MKAFLYISIFVIGGFLWVWALSCDNLNSQYNIHPADFDEEFECGTASVRERQLQPRSAELRILMIELNTLDGSPCVTVDSAASILTGEVQNFWGFHMDVDYTNLTTTVVDTPLVIPVVGVSNWLTQSIVNPYLASQNLSSSYYGIVICLIPTKAYGWVGLQSGTMLICATPQPSKVPLVLAHELGHYYGLNHSLGTFYAGCQYSSGSGEDVMAFALRTLSPHQLNVLNIDNFVSSDAQVYWLNPVNVDKSAIEFAPGWFIYQRDATSNNRIHIQHDNYRVMLEDILPETEQVYVTENNYEISWGGRAKDYIGRVYGADVSALHPYAIPIIIRQIPDPCE